MQAFNTVYFVGEQFPMINNLGKYQNFKIDTNNKKFENIYEFIRPLT